MIFNIVGLLLGFQRFIEALVYVPTLNGQQMYGWPLVALAERFRASGTKHMMLTRSHLIVNLSVG